MGNLWQLFQIISLTRLISADFDEKVYKLSNEIFENYFQGFKCVTYAADDVTNLDRLTEILPMFVLDLSGGIPPGNVLKEAFEQGCGGVIVHTKMKNRLAMARAFIDAKNTAIGNRYNRERYLFLPVSENDTNSDFLTDDSMFFLPNVLLVSPDAPSERFLLIGHTVFDLGKDDPIEVLDAWTASEGFERSANLYPDRIRDVKGKQLVFGLMHYVPYSVIVHEGNKTIYDGVETRIAAQFVETINGSYTGLDHPIEMWGNKFPNGSGNGIFGSVQRHDADLGYSAIYQWYCDVLDCSYPYIRAEVICLVPKPKTLTSWMTILLPFTTTTWIVLIISYFFSCWFVFGISLMTQRLRGGKISGSLVSTAFMSAYNIFRLQMQQIPKLSHKNHPLANYFKITIFYYFSVSVFWQGGISSILTVPRYEPPIDTAEELVARWPKVRWGANHNVWIYSIENSTQTTMYEIVKKFEIHDEKTLVRRTRTQDFAYFMEKLPNNHYGFSEYINEDTVPYLRLMKYNIYFGYAVMILPRGSPYTEKLDHVIHWLFATGITQKMEIQVSLERINNHLQNMIRFSNEKHSGQAILTVGHIQGPIYIYFGGIVISTAALIGERFVGSRKAKKINRKKIKKKI